MPQAEDTLIVVELTHHSLHALRAAKGTVEAGGECILQNKAAVEAILGAVAPGWKEGGLKGEAFIWPDTAGWRVSTDTEAMLDRTADALSAIAAGDMRGGSEFAYAACGAGDGAAVTEEGTEKWVMAYSPGASLERVSEALADFRIESDGAGPAAFAHILAVSAALRAAGSGAVALWDLGSERSSLILVTANGVEGAAPCPVGLESIFEAVQTALRLKFRGAGERLFFNEAYDFTEAGPKVAAVVGPAVREALGRLPQLEAPPFLACIGLTGKQAWFAREIAAAAGTAPWEAPLGKLAAELGLTFADASVEASFSLASAGLLGLLAGRMRAGDAWLPGWAEAQAPAESPEPAPAEEPEPVIPPAPVARPAAAPQRAKPSLSVEPGTAAAPAPSKPTRPPSVPNPTAPAPAGAPRVSFSNPGARPPAAPPPAFAPPAPAPAPQFSAPPPASQHSEPPMYAAPPSAPAPQFAAPPASAPLPPPAAPAKFGTTQAPRPPSFSNPGFALPPGAEDEGPAMPPPPAPPVVPPISAGLPKVPLTAGGAPKTAVTALPFEAGKPKAADPSAVGPPAAPRSRTLFYVGLAVAATVVFAAIMIVLDARRERANALYLEQQEELAHHVAEEKLQAAEKAAAEDAERARKEMEAAIAITKQQTADETRRAVLAEVEAERLSKLPGTLVVATSPPGASVSIDGGAPLASPVRLDTVPPGPHRVQISLAGHATVTLSADIQGSKTVDLGTVVLESVLGALQVTSTPDNLEFFVRPASDPAGKPVRSGRAPANFGDLPFGDYLVTFTRPECRDHVEKATVTKDGAATVSTTYLDGSLELSSDPSGAWVNKDGSQLGTTPLVLHDLTPKKAVFLLTLPGYDPTPVTCQIPEGDTLKVSAQLLRKDRVFNPDEVKTPPTAYVSPQPQLSASQRRAGADVLLSLVVDSEGVVRDVEVEKATDDDIGRRCKEAVEHWKYHPATASDDRNVDARIEVPFSFPAGNS